MADPVEKEIDADQAIESAFDFFQRYVARGKHKAHVLLEGLEHDGSDWCVSIGFDDGRFNEKSSTLSFGERTREPVREIRHIYISATDGSLTRIT